MSNVSIRKFPVTDSNGTEYRVKIDEERGLARDYFNVSLYLPRKRFGYLLVFEEEYVQMAGDSDYIALATTAVRDYYASLERSAERTRKQAESTLRKQAAVDKFAEWDGRIAEVGE